MSAVVTYRGEQRERAIILLAGSCEDFASWFFDPKGSGRRSASGLAPSTRVPCPTCSTTPVKSIRPKAGLQIDRFGREKPCPMCTPAGKTRGTGKVWADKAFPDTIVQTAETRAEPTKAAKTKRCENCEGAGVLPNERRCHWCKGEGRIAIDAFVLADEEASGVELDPLDAYERAIERRNSSGSYEAFLLCEAEIRHLSPHRIRVFREVYVRVPRREIPTLDAIETRLLREAMRDFLLMMPLEIRVPRWVVKADEEARVSRQRVKGRGVSRSQREERNAEIIRRVRAEEPTRAIAESTGLSVRQVNEIYRQGVA